LKVIKEEQEIRAIKERLERLEARKAGIEKQTELPKDAPVVNRNDPRLGMPVAELRLGMRARKCLKKFNVDKVVDLVVLSGDDLLSVKNFGVPGLNDVKEKLEEIGLCLEMTIVNS
jgi:DNA-directed RNA polymerase alpha subunit